VKAKRLRLARAGGLALAVAAAFGSARGLGWLTAPSDWAEATGWSRIPPSQRPAPAPLRPDSEEAPELRWLGHSGFALSWHGTRLLLDPNTSDRCTVARRVLEPAVRPGDIGEVDAALISHAHFDHLDLPTLAALSELRSVVVPAGSEDLVASLARRGVEVIGIRPGQRVRVGGLEVEAVAAAHHGGRLHPLRSRRLAVGYVVRAGSTAVYYAGDTGWRAPFAEIGRAHHPSIALLPIGSYAPAWPIGRQHLSPEQAAQAARELGVDLVIPCHFGTFRLALDRPDAALPRFAAAAQRLGVRWVMPELWTGREDAKQEVADAWTK
jgi:N-acyl-phosphatidylethanolamine-hydrolysing phospholipase D